MLRVQELKGLKDNKEKVGENEITDFYSCMQVDKESLHQAVSHQPGRPDFWRIKLDHEKKYEDQVKVGHGSKNEVHVDETRNWRANHKYLHCLRNASEYCEFEKLGQEDQTIEEDLIQLRLTERKYNASHWYKIKEQRQIGNMSLNICIEFIQQQELRKKYKHDKSHPSEQILADTYILKKIFF